MHGQSLLVRGRVYLGCAVAWGMKDLLFWTLGIRRFSLELAAVQPRNSVISQEMDGNGMGWQDSALSARQRELCDREWARQGGC